MKIEIIDGEAYGTLLVSPNSFYSKDQLIAYGQSLFSPLFNLHIVIWEDFEHDLVQIKMRGSIISMMQFKMVLESNHYEVLN